MLKPRPVSLNAISYDAVIRCLEKIRDSEPKPPLIHDVFIDTVGDPETYKSRLTRALGTDFANFTIEKKADATYKVSCRHTLEAQLRQLLLTTNTINVCHPGIGSQCREHHS